VTAFAINDAYGLTALIILAVVVVVAMILGYRAVRGEPRTHRTRLGVFVERDKFEDDDENDDVTRSWPRQEDP
jgi:hypothetical protein